MARYKFTGDGAEVFPTLAAYLVDTQGSAVLEPGTVIDLPDDVEVDHPRLESTTRKATKTEPATSAVPEE